MLSPQAGVMPSPLQGPLHRIFLPCAPGDIPLEPLYQGFFPRFQIEHMEGKPKGRKPVEQVLQNGIFVENPGKKHIALPFRPEKLARRKEMFSITISRMASSAVKGSIFQHQSPSSQKAGCK